MATYRNISLSFWTDPKVSDEFTPEDKYFYLYLLTNPMTNICGCYEFSLKSLCEQSGYSKDTVIRLLGRMQDIHQVIRFDANTKEILLLNWAKYNWSVSEKTLTAVEGVAKHIKNESFRRFIYSSVSQMRNSKQITETETVTVTESDTDTDASMGHRWGIDGASEDDVPASIQKARERMKQMKLGVYANE